MTTTIREAERIPAFLKTAAEIEGETWDASAQVKFQILLIKNREYLNADTTQTWNKLSTEQINLLKDKSLVMSYEEAKGIFEAKEYADPPMRGRQSMSPLEKLGLVDKGSGKIAITPIGGKLLNGEITFDKFMLEQLLKLQYPNPVEEERQDWNSKPFVNALRLIRKVNELCRSDGVKAKGLSTQEFGIFALSIKNHADVDMVARKVIEFRRGYESKRTSDQQKNYKKAFIENYLSGFNNPQENTVEYTDNIIRYMRITKYIYIRGKYDQTYIDLEPRRMVEIDSILKSDDGSARQFTREEWMAYYGEFDAYAYPFNTLEKLVEIFNGTLADVNRLEEKMRLDKTSVIHPFTKHSLTEAIEELRAKRVALQNLEIKFDYENDLSMIDGAIESLSNICNLGIKPSLALEKWVNVALNILNDSILIKPNSIVGDDNEPTFTAPAGVPDIECYYEEFNAICEVTMLRGRDQWYNEGQPVMRHLRAFEKSKVDKDCYCLFVAPSLHEDTVETYYNSVKHGYQGKNQKIVPITIRQLVEILEAVAVFKKSGKRFTHGMVKALFDCIVESITNVTSIAWVNEKIPIALSRWKEKILECACELEPPHG